MYNIVNFSGNATTLNIIPYSPFVDWRIWLLILVISVICLILSHVSPRGNDFWAILAFIFSIMSAWSSIGLASFNTPILYTPLQNTTSFVCATESSSVAITNSTMSPYYSVQTLASPWLTLAMIVWAIILLLNIIYVYVELTTKKSGAEKFGTDIEVGQEEIGRYYR